MRCASCRQRDETYAGRLVVPMTNQPMRRFAREQSNGGWQLFLASPLSCVLGHVRLSRGSRIGSRRSMTC
jgi:hypothetical protein